MLTHSHIDAFVKRPAETIVEALVGSSLLGTDVADQVFAQLGNEPVKFAEVRQLLIAQNRWEDAA